MKSGKDVLEGCVFTFWFGTSVAYFSIDVAFGKKFT